MRAEAFFLGFLPKSGIPGHFRAKTSYTIETSTKTHARNPPVGQPHIVPDFGLKSTSDFVYFA